jgi:hypothetical protein
MESLDVPSCCCDRSTSDIAGASNMTVFDLCVPALSAGDRGADDPVRLPRREHLAVGLPTIGEVRTASAESREQHGFPRRGCGHGEQLQGEREQLGEIRGVASFPFAAVDALRNEGLPSPMPMLMTEPEAEAAAGIVHASGATVGAVRQMGRASSGYDGGAAGIASRGWSGHGEIVVTRLLESGPNTFPYFQECGTRESRMATGLSRHW